MRYRKMIQEQFDRIVEVYTAIPLDGSISVLTGRNGSGKSLIRKQLSFRVKEKDSSKKVSHASMQQRTGLHEHMGALACMFRDTDWSPTSVNTIGFLSSATKYIQDYGGYLVLDEIEVGCGEETIMGVVQWLNGCLRERIKGTMGCCVITHSRHVVANLNYDHWFNLDGFKTADAWLNRTIKPVDIEVLKKDSHDLFKFVTEQGKKKEDRA